MRDLHGRDLRELMQAPLQSWALLKNRRQCFAVDAVNGTFDLNHGTRSRAAKARNQRQPDEAFFAHQSHFHALAVGENGQNGDEPAVAKICGLQRVAGFVQDVA